MRKSMRSRILEEIMCYERGPKEKEVELAYKSVIRYIQIISNQLVGSELNIFR